MWNTLIFTHYAHTIPNRGKQKLNTDRDDSFFTHVQTKTDKKDNKEPKSEQ